MHVFHFCFMFCLSLPPPFTPPREDIIDENWSIRDNLKEWKRYLEDRPDAISDNFYVKQINDFERLASTQVRILRPLLNTIAKLAGDEVELNHARASSFSSAGGTIHGSVGGGGYPHHSSVPPGLMHHDDLAIIGARARFLQDVQATLRVMHRNIARQFDQANLSVNLAKALLEMYAQKIRDQTNDRLYLLTVVTTIVMPLQIATSVYGQCFRASKTRALGQSQRPCWSSHTKLFRCCDYSQV